MKYEVLFFYIAVLLPLLLISKKGNQAEWSVEKTHLDMERTFSTEVEEIYQNNTAQEGYQDEEY